MAAEGVVATEEGAVAGGLVATDEGAVAGITVAAPEEEEEAEGKKEQVERDLPGCY